LAEDNAEGGATSQLHNTHENERVLQAITVPVRAPRLHRRQSSRGSKEVLDSLATKSPSQGSILSAGDETTDTSTSTVALHTPIITSAEVDEPSFTSPYSSDSESESDVDDGDDDGDDEDDDDDDDDYESQKQKKSRETTLAAGVEKISRHKE
jgi:hypothetical protein